MRKDTGLFEGWPRWTKPAFVSAVMALWIGVPLIAAFGGLGSGDQSGGTGEYGPMMTALIGMTTATIAGVFVLMTFRIDRGAQLEAKDEARKGVRKVEKDIERLKNRTEKGIEKLKEDTRRDIEEIGRRIKEGVRHAVAETEGKADVLGKRVDEMRKEVLDLDENIGRATREAVNTGFAEAGDKANTLGEQVDALRERVDSLSMEARQATHDAVAEAITEEAIREQVVNQIHEQVEKRITDAVLRQHIEAVMMLDANGQVVAQFAMERARELDKKAIVRLIDVLQELIEHWPESADKKKKGRWASVKAFFRLKRRKSPDDQQPPNDTTATDTGDETNAGG